jgi:hypothetical protein
VTNLLRLVRVLILVQRERSVKRINASCEES